MAQIYDAEDCGHGGARVHGVTDQDQGGGLGAARAGCIAEHHHDTADQGEAGSDRVHDIEGRADGAVGRGEVGMAQVGVAVDLGDVAADLGRGVVVGQGDVDVDRTDA